MHNPIDYEINKELGECYLFMGEYDKAHDYYHKAISCDETKADPFIGLAAISLGAGNMESALTLYTKANDIECTDKSLAGMAMIRCELGDYDAAFDLYVEALGKNPVNMVAVNGIVQLSYFLGRLDEAVPFLENAVTLHDDEAIRYALAACLLSVGREQEAKQHLEILLGANPSNAEAQQLYAQFAA